MRRKITGLAKGVFENRKPQILLAEEKIEETVLVGQCFRGTIHIESAGQVPFRGLAYADDERIEIPENSCGGTSYDLDYIVRGDLCTQAEELTGRFVLVTNGGDVELPYAFHLRLPVLLQEELPESFEALGLLAREQPELVLRLFESESFLKLPMMQEASLRSLYRCLRQSPDHRLGLEEFLVAAGAKEAVALSLDPGALSYDYSAGEKAGVLEVRKKGWGYCRLSVSCAGDFLRCGKEVWTSRDFQEDCCAIPLLFEEKALHRGKNSGSVTLSSGRGCVTVAVTVWKKEKQVASVRMETAYQRAFLQLGREMAFLYNGKPGQRERGTRVLSLLDSCDGYKKPDARGKLLKGEIFRELGRREDLKQLLDGVRAEIQRGRSEDTVAYLWFLYLEESLDRGRLSDGFLRMLSRMKEEEWNVPEVLPLLFRADTEWMDQPDRRLVRLKELHAQGKLTLLLKAEAAALFNRYPEMLTGLGSFERYILLYGTRYDYWNEAAARRFGALVAASREADGRYLQALKTLYERFPKEELLAGIVALLLRRGEARPEDYSWYLQGIKADLRLPELYEAYLETMPEESGEAIPELVLLYFSYNSPRKEKAREKLYRYILERPECRGRVEEMYARQMQTYALKALLQGRKNSRLAVLYRHMFIPEVLEEKTADLLTPLLYTEELHFEHPGIREVWLCYGALEEVFRYPVEVQEALVPVYATGARAVFLDEKGNRYTVTPMTRRPLMQQAETLLEACSRLAPEALPFRLDRLSCCLETPGSLSPEAAAKLLEWEALSPECRKKLQITLVEDSAGRSAEVLPLLRALKDSPELDRDSGRKLAECFILREEDGDAVQLLHDFGSRDFPPELLLELLRRQIKAIAYAYNQELFSLALSLYRRGSMNSVTLTYLCAYFNGGTEDMRTLLNTAVAGQALTRELPERLLTQLLFTENREGLEETAELYLRETDRPDRLVLHAYITVQCDRYFRGEERFTERLEQLVLEWARAERKPELLPCVCQLALLKSWSGASELEESRQMMAEKLLTNVYNRGLLFGFEKQFARFFPLPAELTDKTLIEYRGDSELTTEIGFRVLPREKDKPLSFAEMPQMYRGHYVKPVLLFADETLEAEIRVLKDGAWETVDRQRLTLPQEETEAGGGRFRHLNRILRAAERNENADWQEAVVDFGREDVVLKDYFDCR